MFSFSFPRPAGIVLAAASAFALLPPAPVAAQGTVAHALEAFYSPSAVLFAPDGRTLYVANAGRGQYGMLAGRGAISRARMNDAGELTMDSARHIARLNAPTGLAWLGAGSRKFPAGTLVVTVGGSWTVDLDGRTIDDPVARGTGLAFFDAESGEERGRVALGQGSPIEKLIGHGVIDPSAVACDPAGNVYVSDVTGFNIRPVAAGNIHPGIVKLSPAAIDALADGLEPPAGSVQFAAVANLPTGLCYSARADALFWITGGGDGPLGGALFSVQRGDFSGTTPVETVAKEMFSLAGMVETPRGTMILARNQGDLLFVRGNGRERSIKFPREIRFLSPGQMGVTTRADGRVVLVLPEMVGGAIGPWRQRVQTILLPDDF